MTPKDRETLKLDKQHLAKLARETAGETAVPQGEQEESPSSPRTSTLQDPLTMALLAEVARNSRTRDFAPSDEEETAPGREPELAHPNLKRR